MSIPDLYLKTNNNGAGVIVSALSTPLAVLDSMSNVASTNTPAPADAKEYLCGLSLHFAALYVECRLNKCTTWKNARGITSLLIPTNSKGPHHLYEEKKLEY